jgi:lipopolysaccharide biosynthesis glycosyltransferase
MKTAVVTGAMGKALEYTDYTLPTIKQYSEKIGSDYIFIGDNDRKYPEHRPTYEKYQMQEMLKDYDRLVWIDCDIVVNPDSPNIFDEVPYEKMSALFESPTYSEHDTKRQHTKNIKKMQDKLGDVGWKSGIFNAGVMVISKPHSIIFEGGFEKYLPLQNWKWNDQAIFNYKRVELNIPFVGLDWKWNAMPYYESPDKMSQAYFLHFAGKQTKKRWGDYIGIIKEFYGDFYER